MYLKTILLISVLALIGLALSLTLCDFGANQLPGLSGSVHGDRKPMGCSDEFRAAVGEGLISSESRRDTVVRITDEFVDYTELSRQLLGDLWDTLTESERAELQEILPEIIDSIPSTIADFKLASGEAEVSSQGMDVVSAEVRFRGEVENEEVFFHLRRYGTRCRIVDVEVGEWSIIRGYRSQFRRKIKKDSFQGLVKALRE